MAERNLKDFDLEAQAFNFNLYESETYYSVEFVATSSFDENDYDWVCDEIYASRDCDNKFNFTAKHRIAAQKFVQSAIEEYLKHGEYSQKLTNGQSVACGFVDGDLTVVFKKR